jgi:hypothetical protein
MFRSIITITSPTLTFNTIEEFEDAISEWVVEPDYETYKQTYIDDSKLLSDVQTLTNSQTLTTVKEWDSEASFNEYYPSEFIDHVGIGESEYSSTVVTEEI